MREGVLAIAFVLALAGAARAAAEKEIRTVSVEGSGEVKVPPDEVIFSLRIWREAPEPKSARAEMSKAAARVLAVFRKHQVADKDVQTAVARVDAIYKRRPAAERTLAGYRASTSISVKLRDVDKYDEVIAGSLDAGANELSGVFFSHSRLEELRDEARRKAIEDAHRKAKTLASGAGASLKRVHEIREVRQFGPRPQLNARMAAAPEMDSAGEPDTLAEGEVTVEVKVSASWELAD